MSRSWEDINQSNDNDILNLDTPVKLSTVSGTKGPGIQVQRKPTILIQNVMFFMPDSRSHVAMKEWPSAGLPVRYDKLIDRRWVTGNLSEHIGVQGNHK